MVQVAVAAIASAAWAGLTIAVIVIGKVRRYRTMDCNAGHTNSPVQDAGAR